MCCFMTLRFCFIFVVLCYVTLAQTSEANREIVPKVGSADTTTK